ncbi:MAG: glycerophosphodiester phosphodiesterase [Bacteroidia bacterium]|nr:glycerophosphodiester phosphodiesterase [Bacteroidia bacterium]
MLEIPQFPYNSILDGTTDLTDNCKYSLEGIYKVIDGFGFFGDTVVLKQTRDRISLFGYKNISYFILNAGQKNSEIFFEGYWRFAINDETGLARFNISNADKLISGDTTITNISISGEFGTDNITPFSPINLQLVKKFSTRLREDPFIICAHRSGGRTSDKLPVSENSVAMINYTGYFGSTGIEIDIQLTKDKVPVLYHDPDLNIRLIQKGPLFGKIGDYTYSTLSTMVRLIHGESIPSLTEALDAVIANPDIKTVWLDIKDPEAVDIVIPIQQTYIDKAQKFRRELNILIGIPSDDIYDRFVEYPSYQNIPSICELSPEKVSNLNSRAWGFRWTEGLMEQEVIRMHAEGRKCLVWTLDVPKFIEIYLTQGAADQKRRFDGMLTNYPTILSYYHYVRHNF